VYVCVWIIDFTSVSLIFLLDFGTVPTVRYFFAFHLIHLIINLINIFSSLTYLTSKQNEEIISTRHRPFTNKTNCHDIVEILLKVALNSINLTLNLDFVYSDTYFKVFHFYLFTCPPKWSVPCGDNFFILLWTREIYNTRNVQIIYLLLKICDITWYLKWLRIVFSGYSRFLHQ
jgi:hypothetical protein